MKTLMIKKLKALISFLEKTQNELEPENKLKYCCQHCHAANDSENLRCAVCGWRIK